MVVLCGLMLVPIVSAQGATPDVQDQVTTADAGDVTICHITGNGRP